jgi:hypothetical protein
MVEQGEKGVMVEVGAPRAKAKSKVQGMTTRNIRNKNKSEKTLRAKVRVKNTGSESEE